MPSPGPRPATLQQLDERLEGDMSLTARHRTEWRSAIRSFSRVVGRAPSEIVADPKHIRHLMNSASWQLAGLASGTWSNTISRLRAALCHVGVDVDRKRTFALAPEWDELLSHLAEKKRQDLGGFAGWCTAKLIAPADVDQTVFSDYEVYCSERIMRWDPRSYWLTARRLWNELAIRLPDRNLPTIENTGTKRWRGVPWAEFPESLRNEVEALKNWLSEDDIDDMTVLQENQQRRRCKRPLKPTTIQAYEYDLRAYCSHLVQAGFPIESLTGLTVTTDPANVKWAFVHQLKEAGLPHPKGKICFRLFGQINAIMAAARFLRLDDHTMTLLGRRYNWVRPQQKGMSDRKIRLLSQFDAPEVLSAFLELPARVALHLSELPERGVEEALEMQSAAALELLVHWPARAGNLASLDFEKHIMRPPGGVSGSWRFRIEQDEVKNAATLDRVLDEDSSALLNFYVEKYRPVLLQGKASSRLFVIQGGKAKSRQQLSVQVKRFVKRHLGLDFHMHLMRSLAGKIHLSEHQGHYVDVKNMLAHKNIQTTLQAYVGMETAQSFALYDEALERRQGTSGIGFQDHRAARTRKSKSSGAG